jgi:hypothetical protein
MAVNENSTWSGGRGTERECLLSARSCHSELMQVTVASALWQAMRSSISSGGNVKMRDLFAIALVLLALVCSASTQNTDSASFSFDVKIAGEAVADIVAVSPGGSWLKPQAEAAVATLALDGTYNQDVMIDRGARDETYSVFLGPVVPGHHVLHIGRNTRWSSPIAQLQVRSASVRVVIPGQPEYDAVRHSPIVYARADTLGHFSDVPLLMWYERFPDSDGETLQYSIVFSNEDSGTPTDALMARWGRASDIEYIYRVSLNSKGEATKETYQGMEHDERPFRGSRVGQHPLILVATPNNCFADTGFSPVQYHLLPVYQDLSRNSREAVMDRFPFTYAIMAQELAREGKIRPFGTTAGEAISDPRNYLYVEMRAENKQSGLVVWVKLKNDPTMYSSARGRAGLVISRSGWYRTTVELPPGTRADAIEFFGIECVDLRDPYLLELDQNFAAPMPESTLLEVGKIFFLDSEHRPEPNIFQLHRKLVLHPGDFLTFVPGERKSAKL